MIPASERTLTADQAARIIYNTQCPTPEQVGQVRLRIIKGHLTPSLGSHSTTTAQAVAVFMARAAVSGKTRHRPDEQQLTGFYRELFQDYVLAVVSRRKIGHRSNVFHRAVLAGQIAALFLLALISWIVVQRMNHPELPERAAVKHWVQKQFGSVTYHQWFDAVDSGDTGGTTIRVQFSYRSPSKRFIRTERTFLVRGDDVHPLSTDDE